MKSDNELFTNIMLLITAISFVVAVLFWVIWPAVIGFFAMWISAISFSILIVIALDNEEKRRFGKRNKPTDS